MEKKEKKGKERKKKEKRKKGKKEKNKKGKGNGKGKVRKKGKKGKGKKAKGRRQEQVTRVPPARHLKQIPSDLADHSFLIVGTDEAHEPRNWCFWRGYDMSSSEPSRHRDRCLVDD